MRVKRLRNGEMYMIQKFGFDDLERKLGEFELEPTNRKKSVCFSNRISKYLDSFFFFFQQLGDGKSVACLFQSLYIHFGYIHAQRQATGKHSNIGDLFRRIERKEINTQGRLKAENNLSNFVFCNVQSLYGYATYRETRNVRPR